MYVQMYYVHMYVCIHACIIYRHKYMQRHTCIYIVANGNFGIACLTSEGYFIKLGSGKMYFKLYILKKSLKIP